jgi:hypothetical protein
VTAAGWRGFLGACLIVFTAAAGPVPRARVSAAGIADALAGLAFDADPDEEMPARAALTRWAEPMRVFVFGTKSDAADAARAAGQLSRATKLPIQMLGEVAPGNLLPNAFMVVSPRLEEDFRSQLRPMLLNAFMDDAVATDAFVEIVGAVQPCWVLPVWSDASHLVLKAAVMGIDARLPPAERQRCMLQKMGGALGLLGGGENLPRSVFAVQSRATRLSREDFIMLRLLYGPGLRIGMTRDEVAAAAGAALRGGHVRR